METSSAGDNLAMHTVLEQLRAQDRGDVLQVSRQRCGRTTRDLCKLAQAVGLVRQHAPQHARLESVACSVVVHLQVFCEDLRNLVLALHSDGVAEGILPVLDGGA